MTIKHSLLIAVGLAGCIDEAPAVQQGEQASTLYDSCATGGDPNAGERSYTQAGQSIGDTYTRQGSTINQSCDCQDWQDDKNAYGEDHASAKFPRCRPTTIVDFDLGAGNHEITIGVPGWAPLANGQTECLNSIFDAKLQRYDSVTSAYVTIDSSGLLHPTWSAGACQSVWWIPQVWFNGPGDTMDYRVRARATRGLDEFDHGYETILVKVRPWNVPN